MERFKESHSEAPVTIKRPTVQDLARLLETQRENPEISITCIGRSPTAKNTVYDDVIGRDRTDRILEQLGNLDPFTQLPGAVIVHRSQKI